MDRGGVEKAEQTSREIYCNLNIKQQEFVKEARLLKTARISNKYDFKTQPIVLRICWILLYIFCDFKKKTSFLAKLFIIPLCLICIQIYQEEYLKIDNCLLILFSEKSNNYLNLLSQGAYKIGDTYIAGGIVIIALMVMIWQNYRKEALAFAFATLGILILVDEI